MEELYIQSRQNDQVKNLVKLRERKYRERQSRCLIEGLREIGHALTAGLEITHLYYCCDFFPSDMHATFIAEHKNADKFPQRRARWIDRDCNATRQRARRLITGRDATLTRARRDRKAR